MPNASITYRAAAGALCALFASACLHAAAPAAGTIRIGNETKQTGGLLMRLENGDTACYLTLQDSRGAEFTELGDFEICAQQPSPIGKRVTLKYTIGDVQSAECQGDPECTKSDRLALVSELRIVDGAPESPSKTKSEAASHASGEAAHAASAAASFCTAGESVAFACTSSTRLVSVCASKDASRSSGYLQYRFGKPDAESALEMVLPEVPTLPGKSASGEAVPFSGGGAWLRFHKGSYAYVVYSGTGRWGPNGEPVEKQGVAVENAGKLIANLKCTGPLSSDLGLELFKKLGVQSSGEEFDFPE